MIKLSEYKSKIFKIVMIIVAISLVVIAGAIYANSQRIAHDDQTQTLNEINRAVDQLEKNNQVNHDTTIAYLKCIVQGLISSTPSSVQPVLNSCLAVSGVPQ